MPDQSLAGKKVAVLVEAQYIPGEIKIYQERFASYGATVDLVSRLWNQSSQRFYSTFEPGVVDPVEWLEVSKDIDRGQPGRLRCGDCCCQLHHRPPALLGTGDHHRQRR